MAQLRSEPTELEMDDEPDDDALARFTRAMAQQHEGFVFALLAICEAAIGKELISRDELTAHLQQVSLGLMEAGTAPLVQAPTARLLSYLVERSRLAGSQQDPDNG